MTTVRDPRNRIALAALLAVFATGCSGAVSQFDVTGLPFDVDGISGGFEFTDRVGVGRYAMRASADFDCATVAEFNEAMAEAEANSSSQVEFIAAAAALTVDTFDVGWQAQLVVEHAGTPDGSAPNGPVSLELWQWNEDEGRAVTGLPWRVSDGINATATGGSVSEVDGWLSASLEFEGTWQDFREDDNPMGEDVSFSLDVSGAICEGAAE